MPGMTSITSESSTRNPIDRLIRSIETSDERLDSKFKDKYRMTPAEQEPMEESSLSDDSDSTVDGRENIAETISINMLAFKGIIKACRQDTYHTISG